MLSLGWLGLREITIEISKVRGSGRRDLSWFCCWRGRTAKEVGRRAVAQEMMLLGKWLGDGLPSWGKVGTHLDWVNPFWSIEHLDGGASQATTFASDRVCLTDAQWIEHHCCLGCFLHRFPSYVMARAIGITGGNERCRLGNIVLFVVVGLLEAPFDGDDPICAGHLELQVGVVGDGHELGEARSIEEGVVDAGEVKHLEGEWLLVDVVWLA